MTLRMFEFGVTIPSGGADFSRERMARAAEAARELGYDHVWAGEHLVADSATGERLGRSLDPVASLAWVAGPRGGDRDRHLYRAALDAPSVPGRPGGRNAPAPLGRALQSGVRRRLERSRVPDRLVRLPLPWRPRRRGA